LALDRIDKNGSTTARPSRREERCSG